MGADYKPGTVAVVSAINRSEPYRAFFDGRTWRDLECKDFCVDTPQTIRPLVVLDLDESQGGSRLLPRWLRNNVSEVERGSISPTPIGKDMRWLADQIEAQTKPRVAEPQGLGAVVEGCEGNRWVRTNESSGFPWRKVGSVDRVSAWALITSAYEPVAVLSEGVTS